MFSIKVTNRKTGKIIDERIVDQVDQAWLTQNIESGAFGKKARWLQEPLDGVETRQVQFGEVKLSDDGVEYYDTITEYLHPDEFIVKIDPYVVPYTERRLIAFLEAGITPEALAIAQAERDGEGRSEEYDRLLALRNQIKLMIPKD